MPKTALQADTRLVGYSENKGEKKRCLWAQDKQIKTAKAAFQQLMDGTGRHVQGRDDITLNHG